MTETEHERVLNEGLIRAALRILNTVSPDFFQLIDKGEYEAVISALHRWGGTHVLSTDRISRCLKCGNDLENRGK